MLQSGSLGAFQKPDASGAFHLDGVVAAGETVGELGLMIDQPRSATVRALRDSGLLRLSRNRFKTLVAKKPEAMLETARVSVRRLLERRSTKQLSAPRTFAVLPHDEHIDALGFARRLSEALSRYGECALIDAEAALGQTSGWFSVLESRVRFVVYLGCAADDDWRNLCVRQADCLLFLADASCPATPWQGEHAFDAERMLHRPQHLLLMHRGGVIKFGAAAQWLQEFSPGIQHHHVRDVRDIERVARLLIGRSIGLVLSGGGARGFAHIGVVRALRESGMLIDSVGGTSIRRHHRRRRCHRLVRRGNVRELSALVRARQAVARLHISICSLGERAPRLRNCCARNSDRATSATLALPYFYVTANPHPRARPKHIAAARAVVLQLRASVAIPGVLPPVFHPQGSVRRRHR